MLSSVDIDCRILPDSRRSAPSCPKMALFKGNRIDQWLPGELSNVELLGRNLEAGVTNWVKHVVTSVHTIKRVDSDGDAEKRRNSGWFLMQKMKGLRTRAFG